MSTIKVLTVADLHRSRKLYTLLGKAAHIHRPDVVALLGDFLDATGETKGKLTVGECAIVLSRLECREVIFIRGNHEDSAWWAFAAEWKKSARKAHFLEASCFNHGPLVIVGFPCILLLDDGLSGNVPVDTGKWLPSLIKKQLTAARALWLMHEPPYWTPLSERSGPLSGHVEWRQAIERFLPRLVVFGHDHLTPIKTNQWHCKIGVTTCVNVGQTDCGPLHYSVVQMEFGQRQSLVATDDN